MATVSKRTWTYKGEPRTAWVVRWVDHAGKQHMKTLKSKKGADRYRAEMETEMAAGRFTADSVSPTVAQAAEIWLAECERRHRLDDRMTFSTLKCYRNVTRRHVLPHFGHRKLTHLKPAMIQKWIHDLIESGVGRPTVQHSVNCLNLMITEARRRGVIGVNVVSDAKLRIPGSRNTKINFPTKPHVRQILTAGEGLFRHMMNVAVFAGLRQGEIRGLPWPNVDFDKHVIRVRQQACCITNEIRPPKSRAGIRDVTIGPELERSLKEWKLACPITDGNWVFPSSIGGPIWERVFREYYWYPLMKRAGLMGEAGRPIYRFHALRHVAASLFIEAGFQPKKLQTMMGHASITMTYDRYGHLFEDAAGDRDKLAGIEANLLDLWERRIGKTWCSGTRPR